MAAPNVVKSHHAIVYTRGEPRPTRDERPRRLPNGGIEAPMQAQAILVTPRDVTRPLDPMSRLDYFDIHEFDSDVNYTKVYGKVAERDLGVLYNQYRAVRAAISVATLQAPDVEIVRPGAMTIRELDQRLASLQQRAEQLGVTAPPRLTDQQREYMVQHSEYMRQFFERISESWRAQLLQRQNARRAAGAEEDEEEEEDEVSGSGGDDDE